MKPLLTIEEVAAYLRLSRDTVYRLAQTGKLPGSKVGTQWRFCAEEVEAWLAARKNVSPAVDWRATLEQTSGYIFVTDQEFRIIQINRAPEGVSEAELIGKRFHDFALPECRTEIEEVAGTVLQTGMIAEVVATGRLEGRAYRLSIAPRRADEAIVGLVIMSVPAHASPFGTSQPICGEAS